ncbi:hypothetical protein NDU88_005239 [Pleurodeles waltl]|uniref:Uncharacterized protein n=1 Tax=Pleurodeles waltl TaxID=8319 RepID=A0AAV7PEY8_PLEWA|nr:hypothetical protein NDU88_005239 [Pleurodeles waltl]
MWGPAYVRGAPRLGTRSRRGAVQVTVGRGGPSVVGLLHAHTPTTGAARLHPPVPPKVQLLCRRGSPPALMAVHSLARRCVSDLGCARPKGRGQSLTGPEAQRQGARWRSVAARTVGAAALSGHLYRGQKIQQVLTWISGPGPSATSQGPQILAESSDQPPPLLLRATGGSHLVRRCAPARCFLRCPAQAPVPAAVAPWFLWFLGRAAVRQKAPMAAQTMLAV